MVDELYVQILIPFVESGTMLKLILAGSPMITVLVSVTEGQPPPAAIVFVTVYIPAAES